MLELLNIFSTLLDSEQIIQVGGLTLLLIIIYVETGIFFGFFLPGDYLLFAAGLFCGTEYLDYPITVICGGIVAAAILGNLTGYAFGRSVGDRLFRKEESLFFKRQYLTASEEYFLKYGPKALIIGRFLPIVRTFAPILAGMHQMAIGPFMLYNVIGALLWGVSLPVLGYYLGNTFPQIMDYLHWIIIAFIIMTTLIMVKGFLNVRKKHRKQKATTKG